MPSTKPPTNRQIRIGLGLTAGLLFAVVLLNTVYVDPRGFDFSILYTAGYMLRQGRASKLYDLQEEARFERELFNRGNLLFNAHAPFEALLFVPLTELSHRAAHAV